MGLFALLKKDELKKDIVLSEYFDPFVHLNDVYIAADRCVRKSGYRIPGAVSPQDYITIPIPPHIKTKKKLYAFLIQEHKFRKRASSNVFGDDGSSSYKRPLKFVIFSILGIGTSLKKGKVDLGSPDYYYSAAEHCVLKRAVIPNGPQGYWEIRIPRQIKTKEELVAYLKRQHN